MPIELTGLGSTQTRLRTCCASRKWLHVVAAGWPYASCSDLIKASERAFNGLQRDDWLEAFAAHARIGQPRVGDARGTAEQSGIREAAQQDRHQLAALNAEYERRFGQVFLICASGLSAEQLLGALRERIDNSAETEFTIATLEQRKITGLRLRDAVA